MHILILFEHIDLNILINDVRGNLQIKHKTLTNIVCLFLFTDWYSHN